MAQVDERDYYPADDVEVSSIRFSKERADLTRETWLEMAVTVRVKGNSDPTATDRRFLDQLGLQVALATQVGGGSSSKFNYYQLRVEATAVERGEAVFRFYLPPQVLKRDGVGTPQPFAYAVELSVAGRPVAPGRGQVSSNLQDAARLQRFWELVEEQSSVNDGVLLPQYATPFRDEYDGDTPVLKRGDAMASQFK